MCIVILVTEIFRFRSKKFLKVLDVADQAATIFFNPKFSSNPRVWSHFFLIFLNILIRYTVLALTEAVWNVSGERPGKVILLFSTFFVSCVSTCVSSEHCHVRTVWHSLNMRVPSLQLTNKLTFTHFQT